MSMRMLVCSCSLARIGGLLHSIKEHRMDLGRSFRRNEHHLRAINLQHIATAQSTFLTLPEMLIVPPDTIAALDFEAPSLIVVFVKELSMGPGDHLTQSQINVYTRRMIQRHRAGYDASSRAGMGDGIWRPTDDHANFLNIVCPISSAKFGVCLYGVGPLRFGITVLSRDDDGALCGFQMGDDGIGEILVVGTAGDIVVQLVVVGWFGVGRL